VTLPEHVRRNRAQWTRWAPEYAKWAPDAWAREEFTWGVWGVPERELGDASFDVVVSENGASIGADPSRWVTDAARPEDDSVEFHLGYGDSIRLLTGCGCEVLDLVELQAPEEGEPHAYSALSERWWARRWPSEQIWKARKLGAR
jgi:hypothetical protein